MRPLKLSSIALASDKPGIYAWYYRPQLLKPDIIKYLELIEDEKENKLELIENILRDNLFKPYEEQPYTLRATGQLKPTYSGNMSHTLRVSKGVVEKLENSPNLLECLSDLFEEITPLFASPVYIGIARKSLRQRLVQHSNLIDYYREASARQEQLPIPNEQEDEEGVHSFAYECAVLRKFNPSRLVVYTLPIEHLPKENHDDCLVILENIVNRIFYPICGRN